MAPTKNGPYPTPTSSVPPRTPNSFDTSLFLLNASGTSSSLSQPYQPPIPAILPSSSSGTKRSYSPSLLSTERPTLAGHSPALSAVSPQSSTTTNNKYYYTHLPTYNMRNSSSTGGSSNFSPNAPSIFSGDGSPAVDMQDAYGDGFNEHTTPDFEEGEMPPLADNDVYEVDDDPYSPPPATASGGGYPPSPRATKSPSPKEMMATSLHIPGAGGGGGGGGRIHGSLVVKVEQFTPTHSTNGGNGMGITMHPISISSTSSDPSDRGAGAATKSPTVTRDENGVWVGGLNPTMRSAPGNDGELWLNLKEQSAQAATDAKDAEIKDWLAKQSKKDGKGLRAKVVSSGARPGGLAAEPSGRLRARSPADFKDPPGEGGRGHSARVSAIDLGDGDSSDDGNSAMSSSARGSLNSDLDDDESMNTSEAPPTEEDRKKSELEAEEEEQRRLENDPAFSPKFYSALPWDDTVSSITRSMQIHPHTANAAMMKYQACSDSIETASRVATFGSQASRTRRPSAGDAEKTLVESGLLKRLSFGRDKDKVKDKESGHQRRPSLWGNMVKNSLKRGFSNAESKVKEKEGENDKGESSSGDADAPGRKRGDSTASSIASSITSGTPFGPPKPSRSWSKGNLVGLKVDTSVQSAFAQMASIGTGVVVPAPNKTTPEKRTTGMSMGAGGIRGALRRPRSRSELGPGSKMYRPATGILGILNQCGGPPALPITSPAGSGTSSAGGMLDPGSTFGEESRQWDTVGVGRYLSSPLDAYQHGGDDDDYGENENENEVVPAPASGGPRLGTRLPKLNITPNLEGFAEHIRKGTPQLHPKLMERIVYEQAKRYKKLVEYRQKHLAATRNGGRCANGTKCGGGVGIIGAGGQEEGSGHRRNVSTESYEGESGSFLFPCQSFTLELELIKTLEYSPDEIVEDHSPTDGKATPTQFPLGVPQPPVLLPAEFECPICFKVKGFMKPSDWTKHVHEDVHPFTCTFLECTEPKSFKRKADWVRHENELHRQLEWWTCNLPDCTHTCYRKDNFVQHLVREHKMSEPKSKAQKAATKATGRAGAAGKRRNDKAAVRVHGLATVEDSPDRVLEIVDDCHKTTKKQPAQEECRFCGKVCQTWKKLTVHLARHMESISLPVLDLISDDSVVPPSTKSSGNRASRSGCAPVAPMPGVRLETDMDIDFDNSMSQQEQSADGEYEENVFPQNPYTSTSSYVQQTTPRSSPNLPPGHQFGVDTPPHLPQYPVNVSGIMPPPNMSYSPEHCISDIHPGLRSTLNEPFEHGLYPNSALTAQPQTAPLNGRYSPSPEYSQLQHNPPQRLIPGFPGGPRLHVQQQPGYLEYEQASGQVHGKIGVGVEKLHCQVVAAANGLAHGLIENNNGQYPLYAGGTEIPMGMMGMMEMGDPAENQYLAMGYMPH